MESLPSSHLKSLPRQIKRIAARIEVIGAARRYELSSDMRFHDVADFFWYEVVSARAYATGGTSNGEGWLTPPRHLAQELARNTATAECCCAYTLAPLNGYFDRRYSLY